MTDSTAPIAHQWEKKNHETHPAHTTSKPNNTRQKINASQAPTVFYVLFVINYNSRDVNNVYNDKLRLHSKMGKEKKVNVYPQTRRVTNTQKITQPNRAVLPNQYRSVSLIVLSYPKLGPKIGRQTHIPSMAKTTVPNKTYDIVQMLQQIAH